ncbi:MAG: hypothetical protein B6244_00190 [Candidatus Cloacimonetes bacterium 4572_55]|nr:MAG: hypothetical protein B6244_00190 [Candidatus Cloacimonetes bacterium 4572_55]
MRCFLTILIFQLSVVFSVAQPIDEECAFTHYMMGVYLKQHKEIQAAMEHLENAYQCDSTSVDILHELKAIHFLMRDYDQMSHYSEKILELDPDNLNCLKELSEYYLIDQDEERAEHYLRRVFELEPERSKFTYELIRLYQKRDQTQELLEFFKNWSEKDSSDSDVYFQIGHLYFLQNNSENAEKYFDQAYEFGNREPHLFLEWAQLHLKNDRFASAMKILEKGMAIRTSRSLIYDTLIQLYKQQDVPITHVDSLAQANPDQINYQELLYQYAIEREDYAKAAAALLSLIGNDSYESSYHFYLGVCYRHLGEFEKAKKHFKETAVRNPTSAQAWLNYANILAQIDEPDSARMAYHTFIGLRDLDSDADYLLGLTYADLFRWEDAISAFRRSLERDSTQAHAWFSLGTSMYEKGEHTEAIKTMQKALEIDSLYAPANNFVGYTWADANENLEEALRMITVAVEAEPDNGAFLDSMGWILYRLERYEDALVYMDRAIDVGARDAVIMEHLGDIHFALRQTEQAAHYWNIALESDENNEELRQKLNLIKD